MRIKLSEKQTMPFGLLWASILIAGEILLGKGAPSYIIASVALIEETLKYLPLLVVKPVLWAYALMVAFVFGLAELAVLWGEAYVRMGIAGLALRAAPQFIFMGLFLIGARKNAFLGYVLALLGHFAWNIGTGNVFRYL